MQLSNKKWSEQEFFEERKEVLASWPTGADVDLDEAIAYHKTIAPTKRFAYKLNESLKNGTTLIQPRAGVALVDAHIELLRFLEEEGGADLLPTTIDSYTRLNRYKDAQHGVEESQAQGKSMLNGFPAVNHGVKNCRKVTESVKNPVQVRHGTPDARLLCEVGLAGGFTSFEGGGISYNVPYAKNISMEKTIRTWQYVDRLTGIYEERGISINREPFGPLTGTLVPPSISSAVAVIEALLAAEQGAKNITVGYGQCGNLVQDVAAIQSVKLLTEEYLEKFGYRDCVISTVLHQWMGGFPADEAKAFGVICWGSAVAALAKATKVIVKTPHEALGVPTKEANAAGLRATKQVISMLADQKMARDSALEEEIDMINRETRAILDRTLELGDGDMAVGTVRAFEAGVIDVPFAPSRCNAGKMLPARDNMGAVRFLNSGNLPFNADILKFHENKLKQRGESEKREVSFQMVVDDIYAISKGQLVGRPGK
ncbi:MAG: methylaspartate mutase subunit E [Eubacteriales bacterium]|jgi:methylaspartate mutase epsilon subunit|nr:methylaspartate mutase subunit E [Eubacteriales bacterium]MDD4104576.1 methylaspartate mutase subunit E [Eubacteriales bacterium]MDD4710734.1 methylaspartate mutase subunit E [Eubacteriales bacterium]NLO14458.1 methylaspartate mutase subunit E [Clostridiales bacterium]